MILNFFLLSYFFAGAHKYFENKSFHSASLRQDCIGGSRHTAGVRYGLFFLQRPATPRSVTQV